MVPVVIIPLRLPCDFASTVQISESPLKIRPIKDTVRSAMHSAMKRRKRPKAPSMMEVSAIPNAGTAGCTVVLKVAELLYGAAPPETDAAFGAAPLPEAENELCCTGGAALRCGMTLCTGCGGIGCGMGLGIGATGIGIGATGWRTGHAEGTGCG